MGKSNGTPVRIKETDGGGEVLLSEQGLTLIHPFFGEPERFKRLFDNWRNYPREVLDNLSIILVDDHGTPSAKSLLTPSVIKRCDFDLSVYEIEDDLHHNTPGALNLGMMAASTSWILIMDSDCSFDPKTMQRLMKYKPMNNWVYKFDRNRITNVPKLKKNVRYLPCTMLMRRDVFLSINGFDEDFTGERSGGYAFFDNHFDVKVVAAGWHIGRAATESNLIATEWMEDVVGQKVPRTNKEQTINRSLMYTKIQNPNLENREILRFSWKRVFSNEHNPR